MPNLEPAPLGSLLRKYSLTPKLSAINLTDPKMPIYEFRCLDCDHRLERLQKISDPDPEACPNCGSSDLTRVISPVGFRLKGKGWYETDFKTQNRRNLAESTEPAQPKSNSSENATTNTNGATAKDVKKAPQSQASTKDATPSKQAKSIKSDPSTTKS